MRHLLALLAIAVVFCITSACSSSPTEDMSFPISSSRQPALHAVQDKELRELMHRMNGLMLERFMTEQEMDVERSRFAQHIAEASKTLSSTAASLVNKLPGLGLSANEQSAFRSLARQLEQHADSLRKQAENRSFNAMPATLREMRSTCLACHTLFRKF